MGQAGREAHMTNYASSVQIAKMERLLEDVDNVAGQGSERSFYRRRGKRLFDLSLGIVSLIIVAPIIAATALLVRLRLERRRSFGSGAPGCMAGCSN